MIQQLQRLEKELTTNGWIIKDQRQSSVPVHVLKVQYYPVQRAVMDILMKMMLISYERAALTEPQLLADILLVEPLFIHDLTNKMLQLGMLQKNGAGVIELTAKGRLQKENGIFEEQLERQTEQLYYSPTHKAILEGDIEAFELEELPEPSPYAQEALGELNTAPLLDYLSSLQPVTLEGEPQTFVTEIEQFESVQVLDVPLLEFICYDKRQDTFFVKVFNCLLNEWDTTFEELITANERTSWYEAYKNGEN